MKEKEGEEIRQITLVYRATGMLIGDPVVVVYCCKWQREEMSLF